MKVFYSGLFLYCGFLVYAQKSFVQITGKTNMNSFKCTNSEFKAPNDTLLFAKRKLPTIPLKVADFNCNIKMMNIDFQKALDVSKYPYLTIQFLSFEKLKSHYIARVEVKVMDVIKLYDIVFTFKEGKLHGKKDIKFSEFNITPPRKMGGIIKVKDNLSLVFAMNTKFSNVDH